ncbi:MAG: peptidase U32 family protein, partial [Oscillospiraceae bacterium]
MEILAPAGSMGMLRAAVFSGANAVYLGLTSFSARRCAGNFTDDELIAAVNFCHARNVKVYVALNTIIYPSELNEVALAITAVAKSGADAIIVQDLAVAQLAARIAPTLPLHGSTQLSIHS